jgi:uncharacterized protein (DUF927 family)
VTGETNETRAFLEFYQKAGVNYQGMRVISCIPPHRHKEQQGPAPLSFKFKPTSIGDMLADISGRRGASNVFFNPALINPNFRTSGHAKVKDEEVLYRLSLVLDDDADNGKPAKLIDEIEPSMIVQTSKINQQIHYVFSRPLPVPEFRELAELAYRKCGGDHCCKAPSQLFRVPGTFNYPDYKKIARGRDPAPYPVSIVGGSHQLIDPAELRKKLEAMSDRNPQPQTQAAPSVDVGTANVEELLERIPQPIRDRMLQGSAPNKEGQLERSDNCYGVECSLFELGLSDAEVYAALEHAPCAAKFAGRLVEEIVRTRAKWQKKEAARVEGNERFERMIERAGGKVVAHPAASRPALKPTSQEALDEASEADEFETFDDADAKKAERRAKKDADAAARKKADEDALDQAEAEAEAANIPKLPRGFRHVNDFSVQYWVPGSEKQPGGWCSLCTPIKFIGAYRDPRNGSWGHLVEVKDPDGIWHQATISHAQSAKDHREIMALIADCGLVVFGSTTGRYQFLDLLARHLTEVEGRVRCVSQAGWHTATNGEYFVLPDQAYGADEVIIYRPKTCIRTDYDLRGSPEEWRQDVSRLAVGNSRVGVSISSAFAGPLLNLVGGESGGIHLKGGSSSGKSTSSYAAISVMAGRNFKVSWDATAVGIEGAAITRCDTLLVLDEMNQVAPEVAAKVAYTLANGVGRLRGGNDGSPKEPARWRILFISTGEISLATKIEEGGGRAMAGQEIRVLDIPADAGCGHGIFETLHEFESGKALAEFIEHASYKYHGHAFREFIGKLTEDMDGARERVLARMDVFMREVCPKGVSGQVSRACKRFALIAAAGELATEWGITGWPKDEAFKAAKTCFDAWLAQRGSSGSLETEGALARVRSVIEQHGASRFQAWDTPKSPSLGPVINQLGYVKQDEGEYYFSSETFKSEVCKGLDVNVVCKALRQVGALDSEGFRHQKLCRLPGIGRQRRRFYVVKADRLFDVGDDASC